MNVEKLYAYMEELGHYEEPEELWNLDEELKELLEDGDLSEEEIQKEIESYKEDNERMLQEQQKPKVYEFYGCKIELYSDGNYTCSFDKLSDLLKHAIYSDKDIEWFNEICKHKFEIKESNSMRYSYIDDIELIKKINEIVSKELKKRVTKKTIFKVNILSELEKKGYEVEKDIIDYRIRKYESELDYYYVDHVLLEPYEEILNEWVKNKIYSEEIDMPVVYYDETDGLVFEHPNYIYPYADDFIDGFEDLLENSKLLIDIIEDVFGKDSKEYKELMSIFNQYNKKTTMEYMKKYTYEECYLDGENNLLVETLPYMVSGAIELGEKKYFDYINKNVNVTMSLKEAYSLFPNYIKTQISEDIFNGDSFDTKLLNDIVDIMIKKCKNKNNESYSKKEIIRFLTDISMKYVTVLMPDDILVIEENYDSIERPKKK